MVYRYYNDGDVAGYGYGVETVSDQLGYLVNSISNRDVKDIATELIECYDCCNKYENAINNLTYLVLDYLFSNLELFTTSNSIDSAENGNWKYIFADEDEYNYRLKIFEDEEDYEEW